MEIVKTHVQEEDSYTYESYEAIVDGAVVGTAGVMVSDNSPQHLERIDIDEGHRNKGYGTQFINLLTEIYGSMTAAPDNADSGRLFDRLGYDVTDKYDYLDQGHGVYEV